MFCMPEPDMQRPHLIVSAVALQIACSVLKLVLLLPLQVCLAQGSSVNSVLDVRVGVNTGTCITSTIVTVIQVQLHGMLTGATAATCSAFGLTALAVAMLMQDVQCACVRILACLYSSVRV
jgi:hypothetical protein